jgi:hypothetical protein
MKSLMTLLHQWRPSMTRWQPAGEEMKSTESASAKRKKYIHRRGAGTKKGVHSAW